ncbi:Crp/Fnr family transcriptional regulator [Catellatospora methionotrophica]|uniref:Crp/Fnr family transcriptional regulator n=1 Tax=Catellatospora methionotrophica TaxID=121620 RepID=A0A8J3LIA5_9ACTN|nr:Crp/Fnr family transcriptional regulator [Catellatospora methionotrophica]GIG18740.1 Crp/Fnr family transcriptional regulator [Catellatospora methionotrophica]
MTDLTWPAGTLLGRLDDTSRKALLTAGVRRDIGVGAPILREGACESHVVLLVDAVTKVTVGMADGRQALLAIRVSGDLVGEMSALNDNPRSATVTACRSSSVRVISRRDFRAFLREYADASVEIAGIVADKLRWANRRRTDFAAYPVKVRLARVLADLADNYGRREPRGVVIEVSLTQPELATLCGAADISLQKALRELRFQQLVDTGYRKVVIRDLPALRTLGELSPPA